jgi:phenylacetate-CoA ligase
VAGLSMHYQLVLTRPQRMDELTVRVEARPEVGADDRATLAGRLRSLVKENVGVSVACDVLEPGAVKRSEGKAQRVVDQRPTA